LKARYAELLAGLSPTVLPKKEPSGTLYRLQALGLTDKHARAICKTLRAHSQACLLVGPNHDAGAARP
jgi:hypothetical protein